MTMALERAAFCMGCGSCLTSPTWHAINGAVFCRVCNGRNRENCVALLPLLDAPLWYGIIIRHSGLRFLAPVDAAFCGHSIWRIYQARAAEERGDYSTSSWFLRGAKCVTGPEHANNTPMPGDERGTLERIGQQYASDV